MFVCCPGLDQFDIFKIVDFHVVVLLPCGSANPS